MITKFEAIHKLVGGGVSGPNEGPLSDYTFHDGQTPPTEKAVQDKLKELQTDYDAKQYQRDRALAYPDPKEQLDLLWHAIDDGKFNVKSKETDFYKKLKAVKDANPKPE